MKNNILCPECEKYISSQQKYCKCGWRLPQHNTSDFTDSRCDYIYQTHRCPLPGSICPQPYSTQGPWYCSLHWQTLGDPKRAIEALENAVKNYETIMEERKSWRDKLHTQPRK